MKTFVLFLCLTATCSFGYQIKRDERILATSAIIELAKESFAKIGSRVVLVVFGARGGYADTLANDLFKNMPGKVSVEVRVAQNDVLNRHLDTQSIFLFDSSDKFKNLWKFFSYFLVNTNGFWYKHLIYAPGLSEQDIEDKFPTDPRISEVNFLINFQGSSIELATTFLFTLEACNKNQIRTINRYSQYTKRWENSNFYPNKYKNFHGCTIEMKYSEAFTNDVGKQIFETLAKSLNFHLIRTRMEDEEFDKIPKDERMTEMIGPQNEFIDLRSSAIIFDALTLVVPPGVPLTDLERMFAAFDSETWIAIGVTFAVSMIVILVIKLTPEQVQDFVFGLNIRAPLFNLFDIFLNGGQNKLPGRNFARYILMMYIMWCMIFRTCYQSMTFENLNSDLRHPRMTTIDELLQSNFTLFFQDEDNTWMYRYAKDFSTMLFPDEVKWFDIVPEPKNRLTYLIFRTHYFYFLKESIGTTQPSTFILDENLAMIPFYVRLPRFLPYSSEFKDKIDQMISSGLVQKWHAQYWNIETNRLRYDEEVEPQVLTLQHLRFGFLAYLVCLVLCFAVFLIEVIISATKIRALNAFYSLTN